MPTQPVATTMIQMDRIHSNPNQPRKYFDPQAIEDLKNSMVQRGLISPIAVVKSGDWDYTIIAGERRYRAAKELKWDQIDCRIWPAETTPQEVEMLSLVENIQRADLNPIEIGNGYKLLTLDPFNMSQEDLAKQCGQSRGTVSQYLMIGGLDPSVQEIANRLAKLDLAHLLQICRLKTPEKQQEMAKKASEGDWTVKKLTSEVEKKVGKLSPVTAAPAGAADSAVTAAPGGEDRGDYHFSRKDGFIHVKACLPGNFGYATILDEIGQRLGPWLQDHPKGEKGTPQ
jgi:ParB family chromosome partitioning protein